MTLAGHSSAARHEAFYSRPAVSPITALLHYCVSTLIKAMFKIKCFNPAYHERVSKVTVLTFCGPPVKNYCLARQESQLLKKLNQEDQPRARARTVWAKLQDPIWKNRAKILNW